MAEIGNVTVRVDAVITDEQYREAMGAVRVANERMDLLEAENAKLRELVRELWEGYADPPCEDCPFRDTPTCADCPICAREAAVIDRMRELRMEVDG